MILKDKLDKKVDKPYDKVLSSVKRDYRISGDAYRLWVTLFTWEDNGTPTEKGLAKQFGVCIRKMKYLIKELKTYGYLIIVGSKSGGYTWTVFKKSQGMVDTKIKGAKFCTKGKSKNNDTKVHDNALSKVHEITPIIKDNCCPQRGVAAIANNGLAEIEDFDVSVGRQLSKEEFENEKNKLPW